MKNLYVLGLILVVGVGEGKAQQWESTYGPVVNTPLSMVEFENALFLGTSWYSYRSRDNGETWDRLNVPSYSPTFWVLGSKLFSGSSYSVDTGNTWTVISSLPQQIIKYVSDGQYYYALSEMSDVLMSADSGVTWSSIRYNLPQITFNGMVYLNNELYISTNDSGIYRHSISDSTWIQVNSGLQGPSVISMETNGSSIFAGVSGRAGLYKLSSPYQSWDSINAGLPPWIGVYTIYFHSQDVWIGSWQGVYKMSGTNISWQQENNSPGKFARLIYAKDSLLFEGFNDDGLYRSVNNGQNWEFISKNMYAGTRVHTIVANSNAVIAADGWQNILARSGDKGENWERQNYLGSDPQGRLLKLYMEGARVLGAAENGGLYVSNDTGFTWTYTDSGMSGPSYVVGSMAGTSGYVFATAGRKLFRSSGPLLVWDSLNLNIPNLNSQSWVGPVYVYNNALFLNVCIASYQSYIYTSIDNGNTWTLFNFQLQSYDYVFKVSGAGNKFYIASSENGIFYSTDFGNTFSPMPAGMPGDGIYDMLAVGDVLYVLPYEVGPYGVHDDKGVYKFENGSWFINNYGLIHLTVHGLAADDKYLYVGEDYDGVYRRLLVDPTGISDPGEKSISFVLSPNPSSGIFTISTQKNTNSKCCVYDLMGNCIRTITNIQKDQQLDLSTQPKGIYFVKLESPEGSSTQKVVIQ